MLLQKTQKLYCYVDETGQDNRGRLFLISIVVVDEQREVLQSLVKSIELRTKRGKTKWHKTSFDRRLSYIKEIFLDPSITGKFYFAYFKETREYVDLTVLSTAKAILLATGNVPYKAVVFIDGLQKHEINRFSKGLRQLGVSLRKVRGQRDESNCLIRLADSLAGFIRDALEEKPYATSLYHAMVKTGRLFNIN